MLGIDGGGGAIMVDAVLRRRRRQGVCGLVERQQGVLHIKPASCSTVRASLARGVHAAATL